MTVRNHFSSSGVLKAVASVVIVFSLIFGIAVIPAGTSPVVFANEVDDLKEKKAAIEKEIEENEKKLEEFRKSKENQEKVLDSLNAVIEDYEEKISVLDSQVDTLNAQIDSLNAQIAEINNEISKIEARIEEINVKISNKRDDIQKTIDLLKDRLRAAYMAGGISDIEVLIGSSSLSSFLTRLELLDRVADYDNSLIESFEKDIEEFKKLQDECNAEIAVKEEKKSDIAAKKLEVNKNKESVQSAINELNSSKSEVQGKYQEALEVARQIDKQSAAYQNMISVLEKDEERVSAEIESYLRRTASKSSDAPAYYTDNGEWGFPLREGYNYISSDYGYRSSGFHKGIDICATTKDKTIVATRAGKVINKGYHYSMGNYVMIDHGDGYVSIYMHMRESAYVSVGEVVAKGQAIGYIGSTGNSTGPHLHFQINKDGTPVDPKNYVRF